MWYEPEMYRYKERIIVFICFNHLSCILLCHLDCGTSEPTLMLLAYCISLEGKPIIVKTD